MSSTKETPSRTSDEDGWTQANITSLDTEILREKLTVEEQCALSDAETRKNVADSVTATFTQATTLVLGLILVMYFVDVLLIVYGVIKPSDRIITHRVVITIIGATTVQLGAVTMLMTKYLFPSPKTGTLWSRITGR